MSPGENELSHFLPVVIWQNYDTFGQSIKYVEPVLTYAREMWTISQYVIN